MLQIFGDRVCYRPTRLGLRNSRHKDIENRKYTLILQICWDAIVVGEYVETNSNNTTMKILRSKQHLFKYFKIGKHETFLGTCLSRLKESQPGWAKILPRPLNSFCESCKTFSLSFKAKEHVTLWEGLLDRALIQGFPFCHQHLVLLA